MTQMHQLNSGSEGVFSAVRCVRLHGCLVAFTHHSRRVWFAGYRGHLVLLSGITPHLAFTSLAELLRIFCCKTKLCQREANEFYLAIGKPIHGAM